MAQRKDTTNFSGLLFQFMGMEDPMLNMLEWLCEQMMEVEVSKKIGADKHEQSEERNKSPLRVPATTIGYQDGHDVPHGAQGQKRRLYPLLCNRAQAQ